MWRKLAGSPWFWPISALCYVAVGYVGLSVFAYTGAFGLPALVGMQSILGLLLLTSAAILMRGVRANRAQTILDYLEQAVRLNLPLPAMLQAAEQAETPGLRRQLLRLRTRLEIGIPVARALDESVAGVPPRTLSLIEAGERIGRLGPALSRLAMRREQSPRRDPSSGIFLRWYALILWVGVIGASSVLAIFVLPKYNQILHDFKLPIPAAFRWVNALGDDIPWIAAALSLPLLLIYVGRMTSAILAPRLARPAVLTWAGDRLLWHLPLTGRVARARGLADVCNVLADAAEAGSSPVSALNDATALKINGVLRRRVRRWAERADAGLPLADAARAAGMPKLVVGLLATSAGGDVPRVLRFLDRYYESRFSRAAELLRGAAAPLLAIVFGSLVLIIGLAVMTPLIELADALGSTWNGGPL